MSVSFYSDPVQITDRLLLGFGERDGEDIHVLITIHEDGPGWGHELTTAEAASLVASLADAVSVSLTQ